MESKDISTIRRFMGVVEGVAASLPDDVQTLIYGYIEVVDEILDAEEKEREK